MNIHHTICQRARVNTSTRWANHEYIPICCHGQVLFTDSNFIPHFLLCPTSFLPSFVLSSSLFHAPSSQPLLPLPHKLSIAWGIHPSRRPSKHPNVESTSPRVYKPLALMPPASAEPPSISPFVPPLRTHAKPRRHPEKRLWWRDVRRERCARQVLCTAPWWNGYDASRSTLGVRRSVANLGC